MTSWSLTILFTSGRIFCRFLTIWATCGECLVSFSCSIVSDSFETPWTAASQASLSITNYQSLLKLISIESVMPSNHFILCSLLLLPLIFSIIRVFSNESFLCIKWPKYWSFNFSISPSNEYSELIPVGSPCCPRDSQESSWTPQFRYVKIICIWF